VDQLEEKSENLVQTNVQLMVIMFFIVFRVLVFWNRTWCF